MRARLIAPVMASVVLLSGCVTSAPAGSTSAPPATSPVAQPTITADAPATPEPSPSQDPLAAVDSIVLAPTAVELRAGDTLVASMRYLSDPASAVQSLSTVFGRPPVDESYDGSNHRPPGVYHKWGVVVLDERFYDETRRQSEGYDYEVWPRFAVYLDGPTEGAVSLSSSDGHRPGEPWSTVSDDPDSSIRVCDGTPVTVEDVETPNGTERVTVFARESDDARVLWLGAPGMEADGCA